jgi:hypothetical protein
MIDPATLVESSAIAGFSGSVRHFAYAQPNNGSSQKRKEHVQPTTHCCRYGDEKG